MTSPTSDPGPGPGPDPDLAGLLGSAGVPGSYARRAADALGRGAADALRADPWKLLAVPGVTPAQADHFARAVLGEAAGPQDPRRGRALVNHLLAAAARQGHTATPVHQVAEALHELKVPDPAAAIGGALDEAEAMAFAEELGEPEFPGDGGDDGDGGDGGEDAGPPEPEETLAPARYALAEEAAAEGLARLTATAGRLVDKTAAADLTDAPLAAMIAGVSVLHGSPDAVEAAVAGLAATAAANRVRTAVAAATGPAAAALAARIATAPDGATVTTLHRLLAGRGEQNPVPADLLVVPEAAVLDVELAAALVESCADGTHLVLCGDPAALPSTGPGRVLADLAESDAAPVIDLGAGPAGGPLAALAAGVRRGELARVDAPDREVVIVPAGGDAEAAHRAVQLVADSIPRALGISGAAIQVVSPLTSGEAGTAALNAALKARLNPGPGRYGGFDPGDRFVAAAALPQAPAGETGTVAGGGPDGLEVELAGGPAVVPVPLVARLRHGWAITVGQAQGTRTDAVVAVVPAAAAEMLSRPLVTTAFTRAVRHLSVVHAAGPALARAVRDVPGTPRRTRLPGLLRSLCG